MPTIETTRPGGRLSTSVPTNALPSIQPANMGGLDAFLLDLARRKVAAQQAPAAAPAYSAPARAARAYDDGGNIEYAKDPHEGWSAPPEKEISRWVPDPFANPYTKMATGFDPGARKERLINGKWEFSDLRPQGGGGGFQGGGAESTLHPTRDLQSKLPASATGAPDNDGALDADDSRAQRQQDQMTGASKLPGMRRAPILPTVRPAVQGGYRG